MFEIFSNSINHKDDLINVNKSYIDKIEELYLTSDSEGRPPILISSIHSIKFIKTIGKTKQGGILKHRNVNSRGFFPYYSNKKSLIVSQKNMLNTWNPIKYVH